MKITTTLWLLAISGSPLLAQTNPVVTLSATMFYLGDVAGSYTITCPAGTSAGISALSKVADVPTSLLPNTSVTQLSNGTIFSPATGNSGLRVLTGTLPQAASGSVNYAVGVLSGSAFCYSSSPLPAVTPLSLTLAGITKSEEQARISWALKANSVKLPQLSTVQQTSLPPQQAGHIIYNTDEQKLAIHNGSSWQYVSPPEASQFQNEQAFVSSTTWTVPANVTRILAEVWGGGQGGDIFPGLQANVRAPGGNAGAYTRGFITVTPGMNLTLTVGLGGAGANSPNQPSPGSGGDSEIKSPTATIRSNGGFNGGLNTSGYYGYGSNLGMLIGGGRGTDATVSYGQKSATEYILLVKCGKGGTAYGGHAGGEGGQFALLNSSSLLYASGGYTRCFGSFPGGGGGGAYSIGGDGAGGLIVIHW